MPEKKKQKSEIKASAAQKPPIDKKRFLRITTLCVAAAVVIFLLAWFIIAYSVALKTIDPINSGVYSNPEEIGYPDYIDLEIPTAAGETLRGWYIPSGNDSENLGNKVVIMSHNYESTREMIQISGMFFYKYLLDQGYDIVAFDYSGSGYSTGKYYTFGADEKKELLTVIDYVAELNPNADIALCGWAFGAAAALMAGCESDKVDVIISDSSYLRLDTYFDTYLSAWTGLPALLFDGIEKGLMTSLSGADFDSASPIDELSSVSGKSFFFIHCEGDAVIPSSAANILYNKALENNTAELWLISDTPHIGGFMYQEENYANRILTFLSANLG